MSPVALAAPAAAGAAESSGCPNGFGATAAANTLAVGGLDLRGIGMDTPPLPELRAATAHAGFAGGPSRAAADARYIQSSGVLPPGLIGPSAYQQAPPPHENPATVPVPGVDLGVLTAGAGGLKAHATWDDATKCTASAGPQATADARLGGLAILPARGGRALLRFGAISSSTDTGVAAVDGKSAAKATATGSIADFALLAGGPSPISVRVVSPPSLTVAAGAKKTVEYKAPVVEVRIPGRDVLKADSAGSHIDVVVPVDGNSRTEAAELAQAENLPLVGSVPLLDLLGGATSALSGSLAGATAVPESLLEGLLPGLPVVGGGQSTVRNTEGRSGHPARAVVLRVELGSLEKQSNATGLYAKAYSIRVKLIVRTKWKTGGYGDQADQATILDLGVCALEAAAAAPSANGYGTGGHSHGGYGGVSGGTGGGDTLPVTGPRAAIVLGAGLLLLVAGRMFVILSRRRSTT
ncbi:hypothetical protein Dvina_03315 [Dactylosporangium vinaceum]|uniref:Uncharacterized protein n=1 Tax=Dactylosporangium vinaceum TaxID=53362 RepID=A0ABV5M0X7_9ACTN|nr:hypothetical protein [Dactylosporangium vinaceum]UAB97237.1 hypothetical protein Dvina_03315 [Dactylosporangium vinaceum]